MVLEQFYRIQTTIQLVDRKSSSSQHIYILYNNIFSLILVFTPPPSNECTNLYTYIYIDVNRNNINRHEWKKEKEEKERRAKKY